MKSLLEKFVEKATLPQKQNKERVENEIHSLSLAAQSLFGVERIARKSLENRADVTRAEFKFVEQGWKILDYEALGWTRGIIMPKPAFAMFRIDDPQMTINRGGVSRPIDFPKTLFNAFLPGLEFTDKTLYTTFNGIIPEETKETITKVAPLFTVQNSHMSNTVHLYLLCEEKRWNDSAKPQEFVLVGWDESHLWLIEEESVQAMTLEKFIDFKFPDLMAPQILSLPEYNPYGGTDE